VAEVLAEPLRINTELGRYTNFANLLDLCALAVPAGLRSDGLPFGVTLLAPAGRDAVLATIGRALHERLATNMGATRHPLPPSAPALERATDRARARIAVVGAHLSGEPLNHELTQLGAHFVQSTRTAANYRLFALPTTPPKPGLVRSDVGSQGHSIELEVWELDHAAFAQFVLRIPSPLGVGTIELESGNSVQGFLCESAAIGASNEISHYGGWRAYRRSQA
jgi:allophanate hydrolase